MSSVRGVWPEAGGCQVTRRPAMDGDGIWSFLVVARFVDEAVWCCSKFGVSSADEDKLGPQLGRSFREECGWVFYICVWVNPFLGVECSRVLRTSYFVLSLQYEVVVQPTTWSKGKTLRRSSEERTKHFMSLSTVVCY